MERESDALLLARYVEQRSEEAFSVLVERHSAMVYAVCKRRLGDAHEAEDASQLVFLAFSKKATSILVAGAKPALWLHRAAVMVSHQIRRDRERRKRREREVVAMQEARNTNRDKDLSGPDLQQAIDALPNDLREVIVSRYFSGHRVEVLSKVVDEEI